MTPHDLQEYLHQHIPLTRAMQVSVVCVEPESVVLRAPLAPNINHRETVFGGSAAALATLAAWSLIHTRLVDAGKSSRIVIQRNTMTFGQPIAGDFSARSILPSSETWAGFTRLLERRGRARITALADLIYAGNAVAKFEGEFVALGASAEPKVRATTVK